MLEHSSADREIPTDQSSVCAEVEKDPFMAAQREKDREKSVRYLLLNRHFVLLNCFVKFLLVTNNLGILLIKQQ